MGVRGKLFMSMLALACIAALAPAAYSLYAQHEAAVEQYQEHGRATGRQLARTLGQLATQLHSINDSASLQNILAEPGMVVVCALGRDGEVINDGTDRNTLRGRRIPEFDRAREHGFIVPA